MMKKYEQEKVIKRYSARYDEYGYSPKTLGWDKGKQDVRYETLLSGFDLNNKHILDIGCGFGDANIFLKKTGVSYRYTGIDLVDVIVDKGHEIFKDSDNITLLKGDFLAHEFIDEFDIVIGSGIFNFKMDDKGENKSFIRDVIAKAFVLAKDGVSFDFLSDKVDYELAHTFHSDPCDILSLFYSYTRNIILRNDVMPFEFSVSGYKDQSFSSNDTLFNRYKLCKK